MSEDDELKEALVNIAMSMYLDEPCRICGRLIMRDDLDELVLAGYGDDGRAAHGRCWAGMLKVSGELAQREEE